jgi:hypothetical protein
VRTTDPAELVIVTERNVEDRSVRDSLVPEQPEFRPRSHRSQNLVPFRGSAQPGATMGSIFIARVCEPPATTRDDGDLPAFFLVGGTSGSIRMRVVRIAVR